MKKTTMLTALAAALALGSALPAAAETQGVTDTEVLIGSNQDLSGIFAAFGAPAVNAANLYFNEIGGVHGRTIRFIVEDHGYQMPKAMQGYNKLINSDKVFAMLLSLGTPVNLAGFKLQDPKNIANVAPLTAARQMNEPLHPLHFAGFSSYFDQIRIGATFLAKQRAEVKEICTMTLPTDFGLEIVEGAKAAATENGLTFKAETTHKPDENDFVGALTKLKDEGCDVVAMALGVRQAITAYATARKIGWTDADFIGSSAGFHTAMAQVPGGVTTGLYAAAGWVDLATRMDNAAVKEFAEKYQAAHGEFPGTGALLGRSAAETMVRALEAAGKDLTSESFIKGMESLNFEDEIAGVKVDYSAEDHKGGDLVVISQVKDGAWIEVGRQ